MYAKAFEIEIEAQNGSEVSLQAGHKVKNHHVNS